MGSAFGAAEGEDGGLGADGCLWQQHVQLSLHAATYVSHKVSQLL
jgi:hypothetical protein